MVDINSSYTLNVCVSCVSILYFRHYSCQRVSVGLSCVSVCACLIFLSDLPLLLFGSDWPCWHTKFAVLSHSPLLGYMPYCMHYYTTRSRSSHYISKQQLPNKGQRLLINDQIETIFRFC